MEQGDGKAISCSDCVPASAILRSREFADNSFPGVATKYE